MEDELVRLKSVAFKALDSIEEPDALEPFRVRYLGRKGEFTLLMRKLGQAAPDDRPRLGKLANDTRKEVEGAFDAKKSELSGADNGKRSGAAPQTDLTLPGRAVPFGKLHPVTQIMEQVCGIFEGLGFAVAEGPDVETDFYNFEALNIPKHHPARDMHDTFYISGSVLLRTHTSPMQI
ncbi:MAG: phenylalanine--tRNA ligase subunit alpha, partial [Desulfobulbaceae bacterium]|nr:phenylalanine--tRNA ligase subunit alpha [Desulfobulbaceae bacterium]